MTYGSYQRQVLRATETELIYRLRFEASFFYRTSVTYTFVLYLKLKFSITTLKSSSALTRSLHVEGLVLTCVFRILRVMDVS